jgi:GTPase Era involved in 16S rRNA processing
MSPSIQDPALQSFEIVLISHTNAGKTTLARTLLAQDIGTVRDAPHVTEIASAHELLRTSQARLRLWDTPGFGDSARLAARLRNAGNPLGWLLREVWDRHRDRPLWCSQQALRAAREQADVLLYLVNAAESPHDAGYLAAEMDILRWVGKPVLALLNQLGEPRPAEVEAAELSMWREHLQSLGPVQAVLPMDAFARCWVQDSVLLDAIAAALPPPRRVLFTPLQDAWERRNRARFEESMRVLAVQLVQAAADSQPIDESSASAARKLMRTLGLPEREAAREQAMAPMLARLDAQIRASTERLIALHGLEGSAAQVVLARLRENFTALEKVDERRAALWSGLATGALTGLKADLAAGGLSFGAGMLVGGLLGGLAGAGAARGYNRLSGRDRNLLRFSPEFLDRLVESAVLRYLAVAHFGRGRGQYEEGEAPSFWQQAVSDQFATQREPLHALWERLGEAEGTASKVDAESALAQLLGTHVLTLLAALHPRPAAPG